MRLLPKNWLAMLLAVAFSPAASAAATPDDEAAKAAVAVQVAVLKLKNARVTSVPSTKTTTKTTTTCGCGLTGKCDCWESQCTCAACGRGAALKAPKANSPVADTGRATAAPTADSKGSTLGSSEGTSNPEGTTTRAPSTAPNGGIMTLGSSGCANGNCPSPTYSRSRSFFRR